tara:strand:- start:4629 stop:5054 length:426 start_codon:yes stop_codon:yes gene_type:complete
MDKIDQTIKSIKLIKKKIIEVQNGNVLKIIDKTEKEFNGFGEAYVSIIDYNKIKGWKKHLKMTMNLIVPLGLVKFVFYDGSNFREEVIGQSNYYRITVPPSIWFAFKGMDKNNVIINISNITHDINESINTNIDEFNYNWK